MPKKLSLFILLLSISNVVNLMNTISKAINSINKLFYNNNKSLINDKKLLLNDLVSQCRPNGIKASDELRREIEGCVSILESQNPTVNYILNY